MKSEGAKWELCNSFARIHTSKKVIHLNKKSRKKLRLNYKEYKIKLQKTNQALVNKTEEKCNLHQNNAMQIKFKYIFLKIRQ